MKRVRVLVRGRVQGVGFRAATAHEARRLGLEGWVRNVYDGSVEVDARGAPAAVDAFCAWLAHGPPYAHVTGIDVDDTRAVDGDAGADADADVNMGLQGFSIR